MKLPLIIVILVAMVGFFSLFRFLEAKKSNPEFCVSCHLKPSKRLHQEKFDDFKANPPKNLSGLHQKEITCAGCHKIGKLMNKASQASKEAWNTLRYFLGTFKEPGELSPPWIDQNCESCHKRLKANKMFHKAQAHGGEFIVRCAECHLSHKKGGRKDKGFLLQKAMRKQCGRCHPNYPKVDEYLKGFF